MVVPGSTYSYTICPRNSVLSWTRKIEGVKAGDGPVVCSHTLMLTEPKFVSYDVGGLSGADLECSAAMGASEKSRAVLSSATGDAKDRIKINGPICNTEGRVIAVDAKHFFSRPFSNLISFTKTSSEQTDMYSYRHIMSASKAGGTREESLPPDFEWSVWLPRSTGLYSVEYNYPAGANASLYSRAFPSKDYYGSKALNDSIPMSLMCISGQ